MDQTFCIIKPDAVRRNLIGHINQIIEKAGLKIIASKNKPKQCILTALMFTTTLLTVVAFFYALKQVPVQSTCLRSVTIPVPPTTI